MVKKLRIRLVYAIKEIMWFQPSLGLGSGTSHVRPLRENANMHICFVHELC